MSLRLMIIRLEVVEQPAFRAALLLRDGPARGALVRAEASGHSGRHLLGHTTSLDALARVVDALALRPLALRAPPSLALREDLHVACPGIRAFLSVTTGLVPEPAGALLKATLACRQRRACFSRGAGPHRHRQGCDRGDEGEG
eukprot:CAMPEP_0203870108 /NCGR_PEP_ID=MMETSP0359-20131031/18068_1 /ASSEMBLY_ACC=CAM_ASM_000338 /TAXON_ID=268821 /ORGANISM="Scrippsiella Hangoei, Strain SHTV-5" /LENGTH=142 /DNA_ID=CAMNT_0050788769 /DNA_START=435 /DNA_END=863 /DNA_ORIENTATION=-